MAQKTPRLHLGGGRRIKGDGELINKRRIKLSNLKILTGLFVLSIRPTTRSDLFVVQENNQNAFLDKKRKQKRGHKKKNK